jgi:hypothetical protein
MPYYDISLDTYGSGTTGDPYGWPAAMDDGNPDVCWNGYGNQTYYVRGERHLASGSIGIGNSYCGAGYVFRPWNLSLYGPWRIGVDSGSIQLFGGNETVGDILDGAILKAGSVTIDGSYSNINIYRTTIIADNINLWNNYGYEGYDYTHYYGCSFIASNSINFNTLWKPYGTQFIDCIFKFSSALFDPYDTQGSILSFINCAMPSPVTFDKGQSIIPSSYSNVNDIFIVGGIVSKFYTSDGSDTQDSGLTTIKGSSLLPGDVFASSFNFAGANLSPSGYSLADFLTHYNLHNGDAFTIDGTDTTGGDFLTAKGSALAQGDIFYTYGGSVTYTTDFYVGYVGNLLYNAGCQTDWIPTTWPEWNDNIKAHWSHDILAVGISTPPEPGAGYPTYSGYATGMFGEARTGIGFLYFKNVIYYINANPTSTPDGLTPDTGYPSFNDLISNITLEDYFIIIVVDNGIINEPLTSVSFPYAILIIQSWTSNLNKPTVQLGDGLTFNKPPFELSDINFIRRGGRLGIIIVRDSPPE